MGVLGFAGAELGSTAELSAPSGISIDAAVVHGGRYSYRISAGGSGALLFAEHATPIYFRGYVRYPAGLAALTRILEWRDGGGGGMVGIELRADLTLQALGSTGGAGAGYGVTPLTPDVWHRLEVLIHQAANYTEIRLNRRQEIISTTLGISAALGQVVLMSTSGNVYWDDVHVTEDGWPGPGFVIARQGRPGTGTYDDFTKVGGTIDAIWSDTPAVIATNAASTAVNQTQTMRVEACSGVAIAAKYGPHYLAARDTVLGARIYVHGHRSSGGQDHYIARVTNGVLTRSGSFNWTTLDMVRSSEIFPATLAQLDAMEIGAARGVLSTAANLIVNDVWLMVSYAVTPPAVSAFTGFETGALAEVASVIGSLAVDTAQVRTGTFALKGIGPGALFLIHPDPIEADQVWLRGYVFFAALPTGTETLFSLRDVNGSAVVVRVLSDGRARLAVGATFATGVAGTFVAGSWNYIEVFKRASVAFGDGSATLWVNDTVLTLPIVETGGTTVFAYGEVRTTAFTCWFDDLVLSEAGRIGPGRVIARQGLPGGVAADAAWVETGGTIDAVWSNTPSNPATFSQAALNTAQTMLVNSQANGGSLLSPTDLIVACRVVAMARYDAGVSGGPTALRIRLPRPGMPLLIKDVAVALTSTTPRLVYGEVFAAVLAELNALQIGGAHGAVGPSLMRIDDLWLMVAYTDLRILDLPASSTPAPVAIVEIEL